MNKLHLNTEKNSVNKNESYSSEMDMGFGYVQIQDNEFLRNFLQKIEVNESNEQLILTFSKFADKPVTIDFKNQQMKLPFNNVKSFKKLVSVTYEYIKDKKSVVMKTFRFEKGKLHRGIKYLV